MILTIAYLLQCLPMTPENLPISLIESHWQSENSIINWVNLAGFAEVYVDEKPNDRRYEGQT